MLEIEGSPIETAHAVFDDPPRRTLLQVGSPPTSETPLCNRIARARSELSRAERRLSRMRVSMRGVERDDPGFGDLLRLLHFLERSRFNRQLELDALLCERRGLLVSAAGSVPRRRAAR